jgi:TonB family protein
MITPVHLPTFLGADPPARLAIPPPASSSTWRYAGAPRSRFPWTAAVLASLGIHALLLFGLGRPAISKPRVVADNSITVSLVLPRVEDLEPVDAGLDERTEVKAELITAPRLMDVPTVTTTSDFVQQLDFSTFVGRPDLRSTEVVVAGDLSHLIDKARVVFDIADLDRAPEITLQPELPYPSQLKMAGIGATLLVEFIVDEDGRPHDPVILESSTSGFDDAVRTGILRWRFRPGMKNGGKVSTRVRVPIEYRTVN